MKLATTQLSAFVAASCLAVNAMPTPASAESTLRALVYRGKLSAVPFLHEIISKDPTADQTSSRNSCDGCAEAVRDLLKATYSDIKVTFAGPDEATKINAQTLAGVSIFAQPGGDDLDDAWGEAKPYAEAMRDFVANGGRYLGFCLGAFLAGDDPGFGLITEGDKAVREIKQRGAQVKNTSDTVIQVDWKFSTDEKQGDKEDGRWLYFQDGAALKLAKGSPAQVLGRYSKNGDVAATLSAYGKGWVATTGPHPEADQSWYDDAEIENPEGVRTDIGMDFVRAALEA